MKLLASFLKQVIKEVVHTGKIIASKSCRELSLLIQGLSEHGCLGCLAPEEFLDSNVWHPLILAILLP